MRLSFIYPQALWLLILVPLMVWLAVLGPRRPNPRRFWIGLSLRTLLIITVILALAGIQLQLQTDVLTTIFLLDASDSVPTEEQERGEALIRYAVQEMPKGDQAAVIVFGEDALVEHLASTDNTLTDFASIPVTSRTDIASALQLALALFPNEGAKRIILLSDGQENLGYALKQAELVAAHQIELRYVPLSGLPGEIEVLVSALETQTNLRQGQQFDLTVVVNSSAATQAALQVFADGQIFHNQEVSLREGDNRFLIPVTAQETGFHRYMAQIIPEADARLQNNQASAFTVVSGPPRVLIVEGAMGEASNFVRALESAEMQIETSLPAGMPGTLQELASYETIVLANVPANALPPGIMEALQVYVRDLGKGLIMTGGENSFGAGGYLRTPLEETMPVDMDVRNKELMANLALVLTIDKSGSMGRCHCDNPDLNQTYTRQEVGQPKVDIAKEAVMRAASALGNQDYLGVVAFDEQANWALEPTLLVDNYTIEQSIGSIMAEGQTNVGAGIQAAYEALQTIDAKRKHIILLTDGWTHSGDLTAMVQEMADNGVTLSVIAAGGGSAEYLEQLSETGGGRYYPAQDILSVPDIFLKETVQSVGEYIIEEPFYPLPNLPGPALQGLDTLTLPALFGYNGTTPKTAARLDLLTLRGDPLLATWQYGLGRSAVWTSDLKGQWAVDWITWDGFAKFSSQLVSWVLPAPQVEGLTPHITLENGQATLRLEALDENGQPLNFLNAQAVIIDPVLASKEVNLEQTGPGIYQGNFQASEAGSYLIRLGVNDQDHQSLGQQTLGMVVPYSPEYRSGGVDLAKLSELAQVTGGGELIDPTQAFIHDLQSASYAREIWQQLLLGVALLFPLDVAIRRLIFGKDDLQKARAWLQERLRPLSRTARTGQEPKVLGNLFIARDRARRRTAKPEIDQSLESSPSPTIMSDAAANQPPPKIKPSAPGDQDTLSRLKKAKKRARGDQGD